MEYSVFCPLVDEVIDAIDCIENADVVRGIIIEDSMPQKFIQKENWREICKKCKYFDY